MKKVFVAYPYALVDYRETLGSAANGVVELVYADEVITSKHILEKITDLMTSADLCLFDLTSANANVALELGVAIGLKLNYRVLLDNTSASDVFSDMRGWDQLRYKDAAELRDKLDTLFRHEATFRRPTARLTPEELNVQPYLHIDLHGGMSGPDGSFLEGFVRNVGDGIAREPMLHLPELGDVRLGGVMKPEETVPLKFRYDDKSCYTNPLDDSMASVEFEDRLGNLYRQEGPVSQTLTPGGVIRTYYINSFGVPYKVPSRDIATSAVGAPTRVEPIPRLHGGRTRTNQAITRIGFGQHANALRETHYGAAATPRQETSRIDAFDETDDNELARIIRRLPGCNNFTVLPVAEGIISSDAAFDLKSFGSAVNAIHIKTGGGLAVRFQAKGAHQFYDLFRTLGSAYALTQFMHRHYQTYPVADVAFGFTIVGTQYPDILPTPTYEGWYTIDVSRDSFAGSATDAVVACLRAGSQPRQNREEIRTGLEKFWAQEFADFS